MKFNSTKIYVCQFNGTLCERIQVSCKHFASLTSRTYRISKQNTDYCTGKKWKKTNWLGNLIVVRVRAVLYISLSRDQEYKKSPNKMPLSHCEKWPLQDQRLEKTPRTVNKANRRAHTDAPACGASHKHHLEPWRPALTQVLYLSRDFIAFALTSAVFSQPHSLYFFPSFLRGRLLIGDNDSQFFVLFLLCIYSACYLVLMLLEVFTYIRKRLH